MRVDRGRRVCTKTRRSRTASRETRQQIVEAGHRVSDPYSFFTDPDPDPEDPD